MVEASYLSAVGIITVPDIDLAHEASSRDQTFILRTELALHEILVEDLDVLYFDCAILVDVVDAGNHVGGRREELVTLGIPVDRADIRLLIVRLVLSFHMRDLNMFEFTEVISAQIKQACCEPSTGSRQQPVLGVELGEVDVSAVSIRRSLPQVHAKVGVVLERLDLLMVLIVNSHFSIRVHALCKHAHLCGL